MTGPVTAWRTALRTAAACLIATAAIVGCSSDEPPPDPGLTFSRDAYCDAMHTSARDIDADGLAQGDARALENAGNTYIRLARLAPDRLEDAWATLIADLDSLIAEANG
ncbi:MAG: hypothetical protein FWD59_06615, partial [Micrococcales bacterium]|nr:hypothetical protein [Micrococcales bacterium]